MTGPSNLARFSNRLDVKQQEAMKADEGDAMTENRKIDDDELVEITGAGEFAVEENPGARPEPGAGGVTGPEHDNKSGGDQEFGEG